LAELQGLRFVERGKGRGGVVVGVCAIAEDFEEVEMGGVLGRGGESLDLWCLEEFGEDEGVWCGGCSCDEVGGGAG